MNETKQPLRARDAYALWAPSYDEETVLSHLDNLTVPQLGAPHASTRLMDVGCGTGRRLRDAQSQCDAAYGIDPVREMIEVGDVRHRCAVADVLALPLPDASFNLVWFRLAIGHVADIGGAYRELSRITAPGGRVVVTDLHPDAALSGSRRTFLDARGVEHAVEHHVHTVEHHCDCANAAGLTLVEAKSVPVGPEVKQYYDDSGRGEAYLKQLDSPLLLALLFEV